MLLVLLLAAPAAFFAHANDSTRVATVRGMLETTAGNGAKTSPAPGVLVTLGNKTYTSPAVYSGKDGLYYIPNVVPGNYTLKVWANPKNPLTFPVTVTGPLTDIPPVIVTPKTAVQANAAAAGKAKTAARARQRAQSQ
jgi:hypothetical protein